jgi:MYXO-CTERM domain-containing protein
VVALTDTSAPSRDIVCTGTLVSPHVVVAAGHCVDFPPYEAPSFVYFGADPAAGGTFVPIRATRTPPAYVPEYTEDGRILHDISVVILEDAAPSEAVPYALASVAPAVGASARFVGFGCREATGDCGPSGEKYEVAAPITAVNAIDFDYGVATCNGDSGGPAFLVEGGHEVLAGVTSTGDSLCAEFGTDTRVDAFADWVLDVVHGEDPDTCTGDACPCAADGACTVACDRPGNDPDCPADCGADGTCDVDCPARDPDCPPALDDGAACERDDQCASDVCEGVCRAACTHAAPVCAEGLVCETNRFGADVCVSHSSGCGCRVGGGGAGGRTGLWLGVLGVMGLCAAAWRARRRRVC